ncbi:MAG: protein kinase [Acidobacteria bacterium]|nr:protein kinase [Acidobacteriota bacterium]
MRQLQQEFLGTERFLVKRLLGTGTFGVVYEVYDKENNSLIALKKLRNSIYEQNSEALYRFKQEFRALTDVIHPNLATLYELIFDNNSWFFTMELVEGVNFIDYVYKEEKLRVILTNALAAIKDTSKDALTATIVPIEPVVDDNTIFVNAPTSGASNQTEIIPNVLYSKSTLEVQTLTRLRAALRQLAEGIHALHKAGKLHRDLKPSNVLVTSTGRVVILDFGLVIEQSLENLEVDLVGTPTHMSPEQAAGHTITPASDWYSFGVILYQALTGKLPFSGKIFEVLSKKQVLDPVAPSQLADDVPSDLSELCMALLRREPSTRPTGQEILLWLESEADLTSPTYNATSNPTFVGRENLLIALEQAFLSTKTNVTNIAYISGISGIGKTALVKYFLSKIRNQDSNILILSGRCYEQESMPYKAFDSLIDSLAQYLKHLPEFQLMNLLPSGFPALTRLFPVLKSVEFQNKFAKSLDIPDTQELRRRAFAALRELLVKLAKKKSIVIFIDDVQWGDKDSAWLLKEIFLEPNPPKILLITSYRSEEREKSLFLQALLELQSEPSINAWQIEVNKLSDEESRQLVLSLLGEHQDLLSPFVDVIAEEAIGIPFFIAELVQHLPINSANKITTKTGNLLSSGRIGLNLVGNSQNTLKSLDQTIYERVLQLPIAARKLLEVIAVAGRPILRQIAKRAASLQQEELLAITTLRAQHLIRFLENPSQNDEVETYHDRIREAIIHNLSKETQQNYHSRLAIELETIPEIDPEILVVHFLQAGNQEKTAKYAFDAGEKANQTLAFDRASHFYQICLNLNSENMTALELKTLHLKLAEVLASAGRSAEAAYMFLAASENSSSEEWLDLQRRAGEQYLVAGLINDGLSIFFTILHALGMILPETPKEALEAVIVLRKQIECKGLVFNERNLSELSTNERLQIDTCWSIVIGLTFIDTIKAAAFQAGHLLLALEAGEAYRLYRAVTIEMAYRATAGTSSQNIVKEFCDFSEKLLEKVPSANRPHARGLYKLILSAVAYFYGEWKKIPPITSEADKILREECTNVPWEIDSSNLYLFRALYFMGEIKAISNHLPIILKEVQERGNLWVAALLHSRFYIIHLAEDKPENAKEQLAESIKAWSNQSFYMQHYWNLFGNVEVLLYSQEGEKAWQLINNSWAKLKESMLLRVQVFLLESLYLHARSALAISLKLENNKTKNYLKIAQENAEKIKEQNAAWALPLALLIEASIFMIELDYPKAISLLVKAEENLIAVDMYLYAYSARYRRGQLIGLEEGETLQKEAFNWMSEQNIKNPSRIVDMLIPGNF